MSTRRRHMSRLSPGCPAGRKVMRVTLTGVDQDECIAVTIHGITHYLHSTTAAELHKALGARLREWNKIAAAHHSESQIRLGVDLFDEMEAEARVATADADSAPAEVDH